jgi:hypothetical protein
MDNMNTKMIQVLEKKEYEIVKSFQKTIQKLM